jgi:antitoxin ParD1/3/4
LDRFGKGYFPALLIGTRGSLGPLTAAAQDRVESGRTASVSEVVRAGLRALDREEALLDERRKARVTEALADPRPVQPAEWVRSGLAARHAKRTGKALDDKRPRRLAPDRRRRPHPPL